jgi:hypothetical protein
MPMNRPTGWVYLKSDCTIPARSLAEFCDPGGGRLAGLGLELVRGENARRARSAGAPASVGAGAGYVT